MSVHHLQKLVGVKYFTFIFIVLKNKLQHFTYTPCSSQNKRQNKRQQNRKSYF